MRIRGKRGSVDVELWKKLFDIILLAAVVTGVFFYVKNVIDDDSFYKLYYARDIALLTDTLQGVHGDIRFVYVTKDDLENFNMEFTQGRIAVLTTEEISAFNSFPYSDNALINDFQDGKRLDSIYIFEITKTGNELDVEGAS